MNCVFADDNDDDDPPSCGEYIMHFLTVIWKVLFAFVPPTGKYEKVVFIHLVKCSLPLENGLYLNDILERIQLLLRGSFCFLLILQSTSRSIESRHETIVKFSALEIIFNLNFKSDSFDRFVLSGVIYFCRQIFDH